MGALKRSTLVTGRVQGAADRNVVQTPPSDQERSDQEGSVHQEGSVGSDQEGFGV